MKYLLTLVMLFGLNANAAYQLPKDAVSMNSVEAKLMSQESLCPKGVICITDGTVVNLEVELSGCEDELVPVANNAVEIGKELHVFVSAMNVATKSSAAVKCKKLPVEKVQLTYVAQYGKVVLHNLKTKNVVNFGADDFAVETFENHVANTYSLCPAGVTCILDGTGVELQRYGQGCADRVTEALYESVVDGKKIHLALSSYVIQNSMSSFLDCVQEVETVDLQLINQFGSVVDHQLK